MTSTPDHAATVPWARQARPAENTPKTPRLRHLVEGLPAWEPLPPGEIVVVRASRP